MFLGGYSIGFIRGWKMTLVLSAAIPVIALSAFYMMRLLAGSEAAGKQSSLCIGGGVLCILGVTRACVGVKYLYKKLCATCCCNNHNTDLLFCYVFGVLVVCYRVKYKRPL